MLASETGGAIGGMQRLKPRGEIVPHSVSKGCDAADVDYF